jgi:uncharacterized repeat protein (TIGR01451 family)
LAVLLFSIPLAIQVSADGGGKIAYMSNTSGNFDIWVMDTDGTNPLQLTADPAWEGHPAWSPDGLHIAYVNQSTSDIWVMDPDGGNKEQLTTEPGSEWNPAWSWDGTKIAFGADRDSDSSTRDDIWVMDADGTNPKQLTTDPAQDVNPTWSPDGTKIAFESYRGNQWEVWVMDADGTNQVQLTNDPIAAGDPVWSPDGTKIAFGSFVNNNCDVWLMDPDGSNLVQLTTHEYNDVDNAWSPDGKKIAYGSWGYDHTWDIWVVNADGSGSPVQLTSGPAYEYSPTWFGEPEPVCISDLQAAPDCDSVHLSWTEWSASGYNIYRGTILGGPYNNIASTLTNSYDDTDVIVATTYYYVVRPVDSTGLEICQSNEASITVPSCGPEFEKVDSKDPVWCGEEFTYTLTYTNPFDEPVCMVMLTDHLPEELEFVSCTGGCNSEDYPDIVWEGVGFPCIGPGESVTRTLTVRVKPSVSESVIINHATMMTEQGNSLTFEDTTILCSTPIPEFPLQALPLVTIVGLLLMVAAVRKMK